MRQHKRLTAYRISLLVRCRRAALTVRAVQATRKRDSSWRRSLVRCRRQPRRIFASCATYHVPMVKLGIFAQQAQNLLV